MDYFSNGSNGMADSGKPFGADGFLPSRGLGGSQIPMAPTWQRRLSQLTALPQQARQGSAYERPALPAGFNLFRQEGQPLPSNPMDPGGAWTKPLDTGVRPGQQPQMNAVQQARQAPPQGPPPKGAALAGYMNGR